MINYSYAEVDSFKESMMVFTTAKGAKNLFIKNNSEGKTILASRPDFNVRFIELPPIPEDQVPDMLKYKIKGLHPGDPSQTVFEHQILSFQGAKYAVLFITQKQVGESYRHLGERNSIILPFHLMKRRILSCPAANAIFSFWHQHWVDLIFIKDGKLSSANVIKRSDSIKKDFNKICKILPARNIPLSYSVFCEKSEESRIEEQINTAFPKIDLDFVFFDDLFATRLDRHDSLFSSRKAIVIPSLSRRVLFYAAFAVLLGLIIYGRGIDQLYRTRDHYQAISQLLMDKNKDLTVKLADIKTLEKELADLHAQKPIDYYLLLSELSKGLTSDTNIQSLMIKNDSFQMEAIGSDPLRIEEKLKSNPLFAAIEVAEMKPVPNSRYQYFRMKGKFLNAKAQ